MVNIISICLLGYIPLTSRFPKDYNLVAKINWGKIWKKSFHSVKLSLYKILSAKYIWMQILIVLLSNKFIDRKDKTLQNNKTFFVCKLEKKGGGAKELAINLIDRLFSFFCFFCFFYSMHLLAWISARLSSVNISSNCSFKT